MLTKEWAKIEAKFVFLREKPFTKQKTNTMETLSTDEKSKSQSLKMGLGVHHVIEVALEVDLVLGLEAVLDLGVTQEAEAALEADREVGHEVDQSLEADPNHEVDLRKETPDQGANQKEKIQDQEVDQDQRNPAQSHDKVSCRK